MDLTTYFSRTSVLAFLLLPIFGLTQITNISPYSIYGIGDVESKGLAQHMGMGDTKFSQYNGASLNHANPATYAFLTQPIFDVNFSARQVTLSNTSTSQVNGEGYFKHIGVGLPLGNKMGFAFGVQPYTRYGYSILNQSSNQELGDINYLYEGEGGVNELYLGLSRLLLTDSLQSLYVGFNADYYFGRLTSTKETQLVETSGSFPLTIEQSLLVKGWSFDFGAFYRRQLSKNTFINVGANYALNRKIRVISTDFAATFTDFTTTRIISDTIVSEELTGRLSIPMNFGAGVNLEIDRKLNILLEYEHQQWSDLDFKKENYNLNDRSQIAFGLQYIPDYKAITNLIKIMRYRAGFRYATSRLNIDNQSLDEFGISLGLGMPLIKSFSNTMLQLGVEIGKRGNSNNGLIQENFTRFNIGFTFAPHKFDQWFRRSKID